MPRSSTLAAVRYDVAEKREALREIEPDMPFRILVCGNFSAGASRIRKPVPIDRDTFDQVLGLFGPELDIDFAGGRLSIRFHELDDFHPDRLFHLKLFEQLRELRSRAAAGRGSASATPPPAAVSGADILREMIGDPTPPAAESAAAARSDWDQMLHDLVKPYAEPKPDPHRPEQLAGIDRTITSQMQGLLYHKPFQELEAIWRGLFFLVRRLETSPTLKIYALDVPLSDLSASEGLALLRRTAIDEAAGTGGVPWAAIAGLYYFSPPEEPVLAQIAAIARHAGAPFLSGVASDVVGLTAVFENLRRSPDARWLGLAMPRFLLRLPYGLKTESTEEFAFEEMPVPPEHERYLWGHPAIACAYLLGAAFARYGWQMRPGAVNQIEGLPLHVYQENGGSQLKPCAEVLLTEEAVENLLDRGFMPLLSIRDTDRVRVARFQSIAYPAAPLAGEWG